jgi:hypothetical protein
VTFRQRALDFTFSFGLGPYGENGYDVVKVTGLRASVTIEKVASPTANTASMRIFGMPRTLMNRMSRIGVRPSYVRDNIVAVEASTDTGGMALAYSGVIWEAWPDFTDQPNVAMNITALTGLLAQMKPVAPTSYNGTVDVAVILASLAGQMGYSFENAGVSVILSNPYLPGTARAQAIAAADAADIYLVFDDERKIMAAVPKDGARAGAAPLISPETGMVGYPSYVGPGVIGLKTLYNPSIRFMGQVNVQSSLTQANGLWAVTKLTHELDSQTPNGAWFSIVEANLFFRQTGGGPNERAS